MTIIEFLESNAYPYHGYYHDRHDTHEHISTYHPTYRSLDHAYDDRHDVTPVPFNDHAIYHAVPREHEYIPEANGSEEPREDSVVTAHHVGRETTPYEHDAHSYRMEAPHIAPVHGHLVGHDQPIYVETHDDHHHEAQHYQPYSTYHVSHPELDHKYDDAHDVTPVPFNDHAVYHAVDHEGRGDYAHGSHSVDHDSHHADYTHGYHGDAHSYGHHDSEYYGHHGDYGYGHHGAHADYHGDYHSQDYYGHHGDAHHGSYGHAYYNGEEATNSEEKEDSIVTAHHVGHEQTPYEHRSGDFSMDPHEIYPVHGHYEHDAPVYTETHDDHHHEHYAHYDSTYHVSHPELDHKYDDAHDVTPVEYHEHDVLPLAPGHAGSYHHGDYDHAYHGGDYFLQ